VIVKSASVFLELGAGALSAVAAAWLLSFAGGMAPSPTAGAARTPEPSAPPPLLGVRYDDDQAALQRAEPIASYTLEARLDASAHVVRATGTLVWKNAASIAADEIWLHLYLNAFKNDRTLFLRSPFGAGRAEQHASDWGYLDVRRLVARELGGVDLWPRAARHSPDDPEDQTDIRVPLPEPVAPGQTLTLELEFEAKLPAIVERVGYSGSFHFVGHWFPKIARREPDGTWAHFAFHPQAEFYADYGRYDVTLDVPDAMIVGATGVRTEERLENGRRIVRHQADSVHDFAWTAWDGFRERSEQIDGILVRLLLPPGHDANGRVTLEALRHALPRMNRLYGRYPHPLLTVVHPPEHARNAGGMEYPMLITTGGPWYTAHTGVRAIEAVTVHELGHQWFQGSVGTNEHAWPFLDEGLTTSIESSALSAAYGAGSLVAWPGLTISDDAVRRALSASHGHDEVVALPAARFASFRQLGALVYARTSTILRTLGNVYGPEQLELALGRYARAHRFRHPTPRHFSAAVRELLGEQAATNLERALFERGWVDYAAQGLRSTRVRAPAGVFDREGGRETLSHEAARPTEWESRVLVFRRGTLVLPVEVELLLENGQRVRSRWDGNGSWTAITHRGPSPAVAALVDPEQRILLDDNLLNNATRAQRGAPRVWERAIYWSELALGGLWP
jgi:hypothetical protein